MVLPHWSGICFCEYWPDGLVTSSESLCFSGDHASVLSFVILIEVCILSVMLSHSYMDERDLQALAILE